MSAPPQARWVQLGAIFLGALFLLAGGLKLHDAPAFARSVATFRVLPREWSNVVAIALPPFEILCGALLIAGPWRRAAALGIALLNAVFIAFLGQAVARGLSFDCGCFGKWDPLRSHPAPAIARDAVLLALALAIYRSCITHLSMPARA